MTIFPSSSTIAVVIGLLLMAMPAAGEVFRCATLEGKVEYRDHACDPTALAQSIDTRANTIGTGENLESIRARNDSMTRRLDARRALEERAFERDRESREWAYYEERAYRDRQDSLSYGGGAVYWPAYVTPHRHRRATPTPPPARVPPPAIVTRKKG